MNSVTQKDILVLLARGQSFPIGTQEKKLYRQMYKKGLIEHGDKNYSGQQLWKLTVDGNSKVAKILTPKDEATSALRLHKQKMRNRQSYENFIRKQDQQ